MKTCSNCVFFIKKDGVLDNDGDGSCHAKPPVSLAIIKHVYTIGADNG